MKQALETLKELVNSWVDAKAFPGCNVGVVLKDKYVVFSCGNKADLPTPEKNDISTLYDMASCSKVISTTSCVLKLLEEGHLRLGTKVQSILPLYRHPDTTVFDLLTHTAGLRGDVPNTRLILTKEEAWEKIYAEELFYEPHTKIEYSDTGFILLGKIVETLTGMSLDEFAKKTVFIPCDMQDSTYNPKDSLRCAPTEYRNDPLFEGIVRGHVHDEMAYVLGGVAGHAGLFSTVKDCCHFIQMILNEGEYEKKRVFTKRSIDLLYTPQVEVKTGCLKKDTIRGIGWLFPGLSSSAGDFVSDETILHTGFTGTNVFIDRKNEIGFVLLSNRVHPTRKNLLHMEARPRIANYIMTHLDEIKEEIYGTKQIEL
jgi:CubicO group peptidase (beta-lactamase class C family)